MIKYITSNGRYMNVIGSGTSNYINNYSGAQGVGNLRFNTSNQNMEVYDGSTWMQLQMDQVSVGLSSRAELLLDWAEKKYYEELEYKSLSEAHPAVKIALDNLQKAKEQLDVTIILSKEHETN